MSEQKDIEDIWDELLEESPLHDEKSETQMGIQGLFGREPSGEYIALKSHDLYDAFTSRELTDLYHKPITEVEIVPRDVEDFFEDLLDEMLQASDMSRPKPPTPSVQITPPGSKMLHDKIERQHVLRQLLLWLLGIEALKGAHRVQFPSQDPEHPVEALVIDGELCVMMKYARQPLLDTQIKREHVALCERIKQELTRRELPEDADWDVVVLPESYELEPVERRALMELQLRLLTHSARQHSTHVLPLQSMPTQIEAIVPLRFRPIDFFNLVEDHLKGDMHDHTGH